MNFKLRRSRRKTTKWNLFFLYSTIVYNIIIAIVLVPLYLKYIPKEVYGYWLASGNILTWLTIIDPGFASVIQQKVALNYGANEYSRVGKYATVGIVLTGFIVLLILMVGVFFSANFTDWLGIMDMSVTSELTKAFNFALAGTALMIFSYTLVSINQGMQSSLGTGLIFTLVNLTSIVLLIVLLNNGYGVVSLGIALLLRGLIFVLGNAIYLLWRFLSEKINFSLGKDIIREFTSLMSFNFLGQIGRTLSTQLSSFATAKYLSPIDTTILKFTQSAPELGKLVLVRPAIAVSSPLAHLAGESDIKKLKNVINKFLLFLIWGSGLVVLGFIVLNESFINLWVGADFYAGELINIIIVLFVVVSSFTSSLSQIVFSLGNIKGNNIAVFIQSIFYIILLAFGINTFGLLGVVLAAFIAELLISGYYFPNNLSQILKYTADDKKIFIKEIIITVCLSVLLIFFCKFVLSTKISWPKLIIESMFIVAAYFTSLYFTSGIFKIEINKFILKFNSNFRQS